MSRFKYHSKIHLITLMKRIQFWIHLLIIFVEFHPSIVCRYSVLKECNTYRIRILIVIAVMYPGFWCLVSLNTFKKIFDISTQLSINCFLSHFLGDWLRISNFSLLSPKVSLKKKQKKGLQTSMISSCFGGPKGRRFWP